jgi:hypothetical protein
LPADESDRTVDAGDDVGASPTEAGKGAPSKSGHPEAKEKTPTPSIEDGGALPVLKGGFELFRVWYKDGAVNPLALFISLLPYIQSNFTI